MPTRSACVIADASVEQVTAFAGGADVAVRANRIGTLVTGKLDGLVIDLATALPGPVYDVMWNADTGWFAVTIFRGPTATRWHNRAAEAAGYPPAPDVLGATTPRTILVALDVPADAIGYVEA